MPPTFLFFHWTTENYAAVQEPQRLPPPCAQFDHHCRRIDADRHADRGAGGLVDGVCADQADQGHPALDALDQDDAAGRRAGSDLSDLSGFRTARHPRRSDPDPVPRQSADRDLDAVHLFQGNPEGHPRGGADGRGDHRPRTDLRADADGDSGPCLDAAPQFHPGVERGVLDPEPFDARMPRRSRCSSRPIQVPKACSGRSCRRRRRSRSPRSSFSDGSASGSSSAD